MSKDEDRKVEGKECPYKAEGCSDADRCPLCKINAFVRDVARLVFGKEAPEGIGESMILSELEMMIAKAKETQRDNVNLKVKVGSLGIEIDRLKAEAIQAEKRVHAAGDHLLPAAQALSKLQSVYGDDLTWDNLAERATEAVRRLQTQAPLMQAVEAEMKGMRERLIVLERENEDLKRARSPKAESPLPDLPDFVAPPLPSLPPLHPKVADAIFDLETLRARLATMEQDMTPFRLIGRVLSRVLDLDSSPRKG